MLSTDGYYRATATIDDHKFLIAKVKAHEFSADTDGVSTICRAGRFL